MAYGATREAWIVFLGALPTRIVLGFIDCRERNQRHPSVLQAFLYTL